MSESAGPGQNVYPAPDNYAASSFPQPVPAPAVDPDDAGTLITVQYSWQWREVLMASIDQLRNPATWQGSHDDIILAQNRANDLKSLLQGDVSGALAPPYWDLTKAEEAGDEDPAETGFPWYEDLAFIFLEGFLATLVSPPAAYAFITVSKKLRLFFIYGQHGALFDIQIDGSNVKTVDTYSATESVGVVDIIIP